MEHIILFDDDNWQGLLPLTYTKPICELRVGILTIREKWEKYLDASASFITQSFLSEKYPIEIHDENLIINSTTLPNQKLVNMIKDLKPNTALVDGDELLAARILRPEFEKLMTNQLKDEVESINIADVTGIPERLVKPWDIFRLNGVEMERDFELITQGRQSQPIHESNRVMGSEKIFLEEGAKVQLATLNATTGPIYIGKNAEIMEGSVVRGGLAMCESSVLKLGAKIYGPTTIGPHSKVGGEVGNSVFIGYSNKGHDGYMGNSVIGEWCNLGADTNTSNLKNNYSHVRVHSYEKLGQIDTGLQFCGLIMGDHSKCGINTMFNTGTVVGVNANIYGAGFPSKFIPSFSWGGADGLQTYRFAKAMDTAQKVMARRSIELTDVDTEILKHVMEISEKYRTWE